MRHLVYPFVKKESMVTYVLLQCGQKVTHGHLLFLSDSRD